MSNTTSRNDARIFRWGIIAVVLLGLAVFTPLAFAYGNAAAYFLIEIALAAGLVAWYEMRKRRRE